MEWAAHWKEKTNAQRQNHPFSWHRRTTEKLEVGNVNATVSRFSQSCSQSDMSELLILLGAKETSAAQTVIAHLRKIEITGRAWMKESRI